MSKPPPRIAISKPPSRPEKIPEGFIKMQINQSFESMEELKAFAGERKIIKSWPVTVYRCELLVEWPKYKSTVKGKKP